MTTGSKDSPTGKVETPPATAAPATGQAPLLELRNITKSYGNVRALSDVSFAVGHRETVGLLGDNGAGKTTLIKIISGIVQPTSGSLLWNGDRVRLATRKDSSDLGVETIYQDGALCEQMPIWRNLFLGREETGRGGFLRRREMRETADRILRNVMEIGVRIPPDQAVGELSGGQRQAVAIARAVHFNRSLLLLDEPTSALGARETDAVLNYVRKLNDQGVSSVLVTHNLYHAYQVCSRFVVMQHGRVRCNLTRDEISLDELTAHVVAA